MLSEGLGFELDGGGRLHGGCRRGLCFGAAGG